MKYKTMRGRYKNTPVIVSTSEEETRSALNQNTSHMLPCSQLNRPALPLPTREPFCAVRPPQTQDPSQRRAAVLRPAPPKHRHVSRRESTGTVATRASIHLRLLSRVWK